MSFQISITSEHLYKTANSLYVLRGWESSLLLVSSLQVTNCVACFEHPRWETRPPGGVAPLHIPYLKQSTPQFLGQTPTDHSSQHLLPEAQKRVDSNSWTSSLVLADNTWQIFHGQNPQMYVLTNRAPIKRGINRPSIGIRFTAKKHCDNKEIIHQIQISFIIQMLICISSPLFVALLISHVQPSLITAVQHEYFEVQS